MTKEVEETKTYGKPEINEIIEAFTNHWGMKPTPETLQRRYCQMLVREFKDTVNDVVAYALSIQSDHYAPRITSPKELWYKRIEVMAYYRKQEESTPNVMEV